MLLRTATLALTGLLMGAILSACASKTNRSGFYSSETTKVIPVREPTEYNPPPPVYSSTPMVKKNYFDWPVDEARLTRGFLPYRKRPHLGLDLAAHRNSPIYASTDGIVIYVGKAFRGYGKMVMIEGTKGWATLYAHLSKIRVKQGQRIYQGTQIGDMGATGRAHGVHLHFEIRNRLGPVDPLAYLPKTRMASSAEIEIERKIANLNPEKIEVEKMDKSVDFTEADSEDIDHM